MINRTNCNMYCSHTEEAHKNLDDAAKSLFKKFTQLGSAREFYGIELKVENFYETIEKIKSACQEILLKIESFEMPKVLSRIKL